ncbi:hypothetical protein Y1Q_0016744 [Alligator mississippiensis]|uniref:Uncharacterized protein n=1 Tax=Alligator mississippiensis TaxID=8496 RepID=A0A151P5U5_ALLMI|nr:hypothetical protein Y1Q_0016744 [Alligator mississippiensis]
MICSRKRLKRHGCRFHDIKVAFQAKALNALRRNFSSWLQCTQLLGEMKQSFDGTRWHRKFLFLEEILVLFQCRMDKNLERLKKFAHLEELFPTHLPPPA